MKIPKHDEYGQRISEKVTAKAFMADTVDEKNPFQIVRLTAAHLWKKDQDRTGFAVINQGYSGFDYLSEDTNGFPELVRFTTLEEAKAESSRLWELRKQFHAMPCILPLQDEWFYRTMDLYFKAEINFWVEVTEENFWQMLECLPPIQKSGWSGGFMVSEALSGDFRAGFVELGGKFYATYSTIAAFAERIKQLREALNQ